MTANSRLTERLAAHPVVRDARALQQRYAAYAFAAAVALHIAIVCGIQIAQMLGGEEERVLLVRFRPYTTIGPPPSVTDQGGVTQVPVSVLSENVKMGIPVPVPDGTVDPDKTIADQVQLPAMQKADASSGAAVGGEVRVVDDRAASEEEPDPRIFKPVEIFPRAVTEVSPVYPEMARMAGVSGKVFVKMLVDKEGRVKKAFVEKSDNDIFNEAAVKAALQWVFTPAIMNESPTAVWVSVPFTFTLHQ